MSKVFEGLLQLDAELGVHHVPRLSDWWIGELRAFYAHPTAREHSVMVGRGGAKTHALVKVSLAESIYGQHEVPIGERHFFALVSASLPEALKTLAIARSYSRMLGLKTAPTEDGFDFVSDRGRGIKVLAARIGAVSGFRVYGWGCDELAKWNSDGVNPSQEVIASVRAMSITHRARGWRVSSPVGRTGYHYETWSQGTTPRQVASHAPTWIANPSITEQQTHELEPDERIWRREYAAEPQSTALACFDPDRVDGAFELRAGTRRRRSLIIDASSGRKDTWSWAVVGWTRGVDGRDFLEFDLVDGVEGRFWRQTSAADIVRKLSRLAHDRNITTVHGDQREAYALASLFDAEGLTFVSHDWTNASKARAVETVRRWFADGMLQLPSHAKLRRELLEFEERVTSNGTFRYEARGNGHDDYVALLLTAAMAELSGDLDVGDADLRRAFIDLNTQSPRIWRDLDGAPASYMRAPDDDDY